MCENVVAVVERKEEVLHQTRMRLELSPAVRPNHQREEVLPFGGELACNGIEIIANFLNSATV